MKTEFVQVGIGEGKVVRRPVGLVSYALGSCVGICLYDRMNGVAGMAHIMLPSRKVTMDPINPYKFADSGIQYLAKDMLRAGACRPNLFAKIAGGAQMFPANGNAETIGERNIKAVKEVLNEMGIRIVAEDTGKDYGRTIRFYSVSGELEIKSVKHGMNVI
ncbi:chemotaxis protein CheD [Clostridium sp. AM58-1XD]|uniref:chemotaxis protein CheD n=1 Tax=Clostridium sp. AM58-1XD TaxID=2292307 RepID=UPI000E519E07|nr:chemotaxis protein CheD [Clostridium sp. AM58-1XD]RGY96836.1 chemotaxis protein CheD [Clostridium sp. AM58-1XD]